MCVEVELALVLGNTEDLGNLLHRLVIDGCLARLFQISQANAVLLGSHLGYNVVVTLQCEGYLADGVFVEHLLDLLFGKFPAKLCHDAVVIGTRLGTIGDDVKIDGTQTFSCTGIDAVGHCGLTRMIVMPLGDGLEMIDDIIANALGLLCITKIQRCCPLVGLLLKPGCPTQVEVKLLAVLVEVLFHEVLHIGRWQERFHLSDTNGPQHPVHLRN